MPKPNQVDEFVKHLKKRTSEAVLVQTVWAKVKSVDWDKKVFVATGVTDNLDFFDVLAGIGSVYMKPKVGSKVLLGKIQNQEAATFLIYAEQIEEHLIKDSTGFEIALKNGNLTFNGDANGGLVKWPQGLKVELEKNNAIMQAILDVINVTVVTEPGNGAASALQAALKAAVAGKPLADYNNLENTKIKHG